MSWFQKVLYGVDLEAEQARGESLDAQMRDLNKKNLDDGRWTPEQYSAAEKNLDAGATGDVTGQVEGAFKEKLDQEVDSVRGTVGSVVSFPFRLIPWQVWIFAGLALFFWMGGASLLKGSLAKK